MLNRRLIYSPNLFGDVNLSVIFKVQNQNPFAETLTAMESILETAAISLL